MSNETFKPGDLVRYTSPDGKCIVQGFVAFYDFSDTDSWPDSSDCVEIGIEGEGINSDWVLVTKPQYITFIKRVDS